MWNRGDNTFDFRPGPVFNNIVLADEINRASPKTQSALLEAMAEVQVTVDGVTYPLTPPFMVIATQNPIEHEGTYPLPESQLDRFLMRVSVGYPAPQAELEILDRHGDHDPFRDITAVASRRPTSRCWRPPPARSTWRPASRRTWSTWPTPRATAPTCRSACRPAPPSPCSGWPRPGPRRRGRGYVIPDDVKALAVPVLAHRLLVTPEAQLQGITPADALGEVLRAVPVPGGH